MSQTEFYSFAQMQRRQFIYTLAGFIVAMVGTALISAFIVSALIKGQSNIVAKPADTTSSIVPSSNSLPAGLPPECYG